MSGVSRPTAGVSGQGVTVATGQSEQRDTTVVQRHDAHIDAAMQARLSTTPRELQDSSITPRHKIQYLGRPYIRTHQIRGCEHRYRCRYLNLHYFASRSLGSIQATLTFISYILAYQEVLVRINIKNLQLIIIIIYLTYPFSSILNILTHALKYIFIII